MSPASRERAVQAEEAGTALVPHRAGLGAVLAGSGRANAREVLRAEALTLRSDATLRDVLLSHRIGTPEAILEAEAARWHTATVDLRAHPPDPRLIAEHEPADLLRAGCVPWRRVAGITVFACARPERFARFVEGLPPDAGPSHMVIASEEAVAEAIETLERDRLVLRAETLTDARDSCRAMHPRP